MMTTPSAPNFRAHQEVEVAISHLQLALKNLQAATKAGWV